MMIKASTWNGKDLSGIWQFTLKIDGVRALWNGKQWRSRADKPLFNIPPYLDGPIDCEVFLGSFKETISAVTTETLRLDTPKVERHHLYGLDPLDVRLHPGHLVGKPGEPVNGTDTKAESIKSMLKIVNAAGYEGLVLRQGDKWIKVKQNETHDVKILGVLEGKGKRRGHVGAFVTARGRVGGFKGTSYAELADLWQRRESLVGMTIEVSCMSLTEAGKFRQPIFRRMRPDKIADD